MWRPRDSRPLVRTSSLIGGLRDGMIVPNSGSACKLLSPEFVSPGFRARRPSLAIGSGTGNISTLAYSDHPLPLRGTSDSFVAAFQHHSKEGEVFLLRGAERAGEAFAHLGREAEVAPFRLELERGVGGVQGGGVFHLGSPLSGWLMNAANCGQFHYRNLHANAEKGRKHGVSGPFDGQSLSKWSNLGQ